jgi:tetratricopeptide (TPR) repeat protein
MRKIPRKILMAGAGTMLVIGLLLLQVMRLEANLRSNTKIAQSLRNEIEMLRQENQLIHVQAQTGQTEIRTLHEELSHMKVDRETSAQRQAELKNLVLNAEKSLENQNKKIMGLERQLKEAKEKMRRQKKNSADLEQQTKSAKANPALTANYVKIIENEWLAEITKTEALKKDLDRTLTELSRQNRERSKLRSETATMHYNLAVILTDQRNYPAAIREYEKVLETRPDDADAHYNLAIIYDDYLKNNEKALEHYRQYIKIVPNAPEAQHVRQWMKDKEYENTFNFKI